MPGFWDEEWAHNARIYRVTIMLPVFIDVGAPDDKEAEEKALCALEHIGLEGGYMAAGVERIAIDAVMACIESVEELDEDD